MALSYSGEPNYGGVIDDYGTRRADDLRQQLDDFFSPSENRASELADDLGAYFDGTADAVPDRQVAIQPKQPRQPEQPYVPEGAITEDQFQENLMREAHPWLARAKDAEQRLPFLAKAVGRLPIEAAQLGMDMGAAGMATAIGTGRALTGGYIAAQDALKKVVEGGVGEGAPMLQQALGDMAASYIRTSILGKVAGERGRDDKASLVYDSLGAAVELLSPYKTAPNLRDLYTDPRRLAVEAAGVAANLNLAGAVAQQTGLTAAKMATTRALTRKAGTTGIRLGAEELAGITNAQYWGSQAGMSGAFVSQSWGDYPDTVKLLKQQGHTDQEAVNMAQGASLIRALGNSILGVIPLPAQKAYPNLGRDFVRHFLEAGKRTGAQAGKVAFATLTNAAAESTVQQYLSEDPSFTQGVADTLTMALRDAPAFALGAAPSHFGGLKAAWASQSAQLKKMSIQPVYAKVMESGKSPDLALKIRDYSTLETPSRQQFIDTFGKDAERLMRTSSTERSWIAEMLQQVNSDNYRAMDKWSTFTEKWTDLQQMLTTNKAPDGTALTDAHVEGAIEEGAKAFIGNPHEMEQRLGDADKRFFQPDMREGEMAPYELAPADAMRNAALRLISERAKERAVEETAATNLAKNRQLTTQAEVAWQPPADGPPGPKPTPLPSVVPAAEAVATRGVMQTMLTKVAQTSDSARPDLIKNALTGSAKSPAEANTAYQQASHAMQIRSQLDARQARETRLQGRITKLEHRLGKAQDTTVKRPIQVALTRTQDLLKKSQGTTEPLRELYSTAVRDSATARGASTLDHQLSLELQYAAENIDPTGRSRDTRDIRVLHEIVQEAMNANPDLPYQMTEALRPEAPPPDAPPPVVTSPEALPSAAPAPEAPPPGPAQRAEPIRATTDLTRQPETAIDEGSPEADAITAKLAQQVAQENLAKTERRILRAADRQAQAAFKKQYRKVDANSEEGQELLHDLKLQAIAAVKAKSAEPSADEPAKRALTPTPRPTADATPAKSTAASVASIGLREAAGRANTKTGRQAFNDLAEAMDADQSALPPTLQDVVAKAAAEIGDPKQSSQDRRALNKKWADVYNSARLADMAENSMLRESKPAKGGFLSEEAGFLAAGEGEWRGEAGKMAEARHQFGQQVAKATQLITKSLKPAWHAIKRKTTRTRDLDTNLWRKHHELAAKHDKVGLEVMFAERDWDAARATIGWEKPTPDQIEALDKVFRGDAGYETLPEPLRAPLAHMRSLIEASQRMVKDLGLVDDRTTTTFGADGRLWYPRTYEVNTNKHWDKMVTEASKQKMDNWILENVDWFTPTQARQYTETLLRVGKASDPHKVGIAEQPKGATDPVTKIMHRMQAPKSFYDYFEAKTQLTGEAPTVQELDTKRRAVLDTIAKTYPERYKADPEKTTTVANNIARMLDDAASTTTDISTWINRSIGTARKAGLSQEAAMLREWTDLPKPLRELWGEERGVVQNFKNAMRQLTHMATARQFETSIKELGMDKFVWEHKNAPPGTVPIESSVGRLLLERAIRPDEQSEGSPELGDLLSQMHGKDADIEMTGGTPETVQWAKDMGFVDDTLPMQAAKASPLHGLYAQPEFIKALTELRNSNYNPNHGMMLASWRLANGLANYGVTLGSPPSYGRNLEGAGAIFVMAGGNPVDVVKRRGQYSEALSAVRIATKQLYRKSEDTPERRALATRIAELGLLEPSSNLAIIERAFEHLKIGKLGALSKLENWVRPESLPWLTAGKLGTSTKELWRVSDTAGRVAIYLSEADTQRKIHPEWTQDQVEKQAAEIAHDAYPSISNVSALALAAKQNQLIFPFGFQLEMVRVSKNNLLRGFKEIQSTNAEERFAGWRRIVGTAAMMAANDAIDGVTNFFNDVSAQDEEAMRTLLPDYHQDTGAILRVDGDKIIHTPLSYNNPASLASDVVRAMMRGEDWVTATQRGLGMMWNQVIGEKIWTAVALKSFNGEDAYGNPLYSKNDAWTTTATKIGGSLTKPFVPQVATRYRERLAERPLPTILGTPFGVNTRPYDIDKLLSRRINDYIKASNADKSFYTKLGYDLDKLPSPEVLAAAHRTDTTLQDEYHRSEDNLARGFAQMKKEMDAAIHLTNDPVKIYAQMRDKGISVELLDGLKTGIRPPTVPATLPLIDLYLRVADPPHAEALQKARREKIGTMGGTIADSMRKLGGPLTKDDRALINRRIVDDVNELKVAKISTADIASAMLTANARRKQPLTPQTMGRKLDTVLGRLAAAPAPKE